jgi:ribonuclease P protein component
LIGRIHEHAIFRRLGREGVRVRVGSVWCSVLVDPALSQPCVAYALGRHTGSAVVRNRIRRQMREILAANTSQLVPGYYLIGAHKEATAMSFQELTHTMLQLITTAKQKVS